MNLDIFYDHTFDPKKSTIVKIRMNS